ncbi:YcaO-like family protein [Streptomyces sp. NPDC007063]|uniref:YcaO-like family protein n=1 Tax=Streptomyces sp. NPDC007063 TaxID=3364772 RepID=UPI0036B76704
MNADATTTLPRPDAAAPEAASETGPAVPEAAAPKNPGQASAVQEPATAPPPASLRRMGDLVSPYGLVSGAVRLPGSPGDPEFPIFTASLGDPGHVLTGHEDWDLGAEHGNFDGAGGDLSADRAALLAVAESLERYSSCARDTGRCRWATAAELGDEAVPLDSWPRLSAAELAAGGHGLVGPDPDAPMRWVRGWSFTRRRPVWVPAVHVWLKNPPESRGERVSHPVSTGCAVHTDPTAAVVNGLLEVVERDSIALTWLQRLRLPRLTVETEALSPRQRAFVRRAANPHVRTRFFDATTDLGIPVIYGVQLADDDPELAQVVAATCDPDPGDAVAKLHREAASLRIALRHHITNQARGGRPGDDAEQLVDVVGGAAQAGPRSARDRFAFLLEGEREERPLTALPRPAATDPRSVLDWLLERLHARGCEVIAVDLTTDEARQAGATAVRVAVPQLMPLSFVHRARYLGHPRLYEAPRAMGHPVLSEDEITRLPQPFA